MKESDTWWSNSLYATLLLHPYHDDLQSCHNFSFEAARDKSLSRHDNNEGLQYQPTIQYCSLVLQFYIDSTI